MPDNGELQGIVERMVRAGEPEENIALVIQHYKPAAPAPEEKSLSGFGHNLVSSGVDFVKNTGEGLLSAAKLAAAIPQTIADPRKAAEMGGQLFEGIKHAPEIAQSMFQGAKDRYGSLDAIGNTLYHDPVGAAADLSLVAGGVGSLAKAGGLNKVARTANVVRDVSNPMTAVAKGVEAVGNKGPALKRAGVSLYNRILKPDRGQLEKLGPQWGKTLDEKGLNVSEQLLKEGVNVTPSGVRKLADDIDQLGDQRSGIIQDLDSFHSTKNPTGTVTRVSMAPVTKAIDDTAEFTGRQMDPSGPVAVVNEGHQRLLANPGLTKKKRAALPGVPPRAAKAELGVSSVPAGRELLPRVRLSKLEDYAKGTRAEMRAQGGNAYGGGRLPSEVARDKALITGANEAIGSAHPSIKPLSDEMARKITLEDILERGALRSGKHMFASPWQAAAAFLNPIWLAADIAQRPSTGSRLARGVYKLGGMVDGATLSPAARQLALLAALEGRDGEDEPK